jgi:hypothetical protein
MRQFGRNQRISGHSADGVGGSLLTQLVALPGDLVATQYRFALFMPSNDRLHAVVRQRNWLLFLQCDMFVMTIIPGGDGDEHFIS